MSDFFKPYKTFKKHLLILLFLSASCIYAQVGIINDPDGFTNVRKEANFSSEIVHVLYENEMFYYDTRKSENEWILITIPKNKYLHNPYYDAYKTPLVGFIHKSRIQYLGELNVLKNEKFSFKYILQDFDKKDKIIDYYNSEVSFKAPRINGMHVYGQDGGLPIIETKDIEVYIDDKKIEIPRVLFENLYECTNDKDIRVNKGCYFVSQWNSDGAGGYAVYWAIDKSGLLQRLIFIP